VLCFEVFIVNGIYQYSLMRKSMYNHVKVEECKGFSISTNSSLKLIRQTIIVLVNESAITVQVVRGTNSGHP
jgi:hypothetical protein